MASVVVGGIVAALAFTGANYGGQYLDRLVRGDHNELAAERKRHDKPLTSTEPLPHILCSIRGPLINCAGYLQGVGGPAPYAPQ